MCTDVGTSYSSGTGHRRQHSSLCSHWNTLRTFPYASRSKARKKRDGWPVKSGFPMDLQNPSAGSSRSEGCHLGAVEF